jgi:hypothetical protein
VTAAVGAAALLPLLPSTAAAGSRAALRPSIAGKAVVGHRLNGSAHRLRAAGRVRFTWLRCAADGRSCKRLRRAHRSRLRLRPRHAGHTIRLVVSARTRHGRVALTSRPSPTVQPAAAAPAPSPAPAAGAAPVAPAASRPKLPRGPEVRNAAELLSALRNPANAGTAIVVRAGSYGPLDLSGVAPSTLTALEAAPGEQPVLAGVTMSATKNIRIEGMRFTASIDVQPSPASDHGRNIQIVGNEFTGFKWNAIAVREFNDDVLIEGNFIHDLVDEAGTDLGYGITLHGAYGPIDGATVRGNRVLRIPNDGLQTSGVRSLVIDRNEFSYIAWPTLTGSKHPDIIQIMGAYAPGPVITNNNFHHNSQPVYIQDGIPAGRIENNLIHDIKNYGISIGDAGTANGSGIQGWIMRRNTVWDTAQDFGGGQGVLWRGDGSGNVLENNVLQTLVGERIGLGGQFASASGNVIPGGEAVGGTRTAPVFDADFRATNVDAGFRP